MFGLRRHSRSREHPAVAKVEAFLGGAATHVAAAVQPDGERPAASHALWICACVTLDDAPTWLIYGDSEGRVCWSRIPDGAEGSDVVDARFSAGGHADPGDVLDWLRGEAPDPWACGDGWGDDEVLVELSGRLRGS